MLHKREFVMTHPEVRTGMTAYTIDGEKLGVIERIDEDDITIERGWFFHKAFIIAYDDIEDVREDQVILRRRREDFENERRVEQTESRESGFTGGAAERGEYGRGRTENQDVGGEVRKEDVKIEPRKPAEK